MGSSALYLAKMQVTTAGGVKVYNLSAGKSLPEWISERKRRALLKNDLGQNLCNNTSIAYESKFRVDRSKTSNRAAAGFLHADSVHRDPSNGRRTVYHGVR